MKEESLRYRLLHQGYILSPPWNALFCSLSVLTCFFTGESVGIPALPAIIISVQSITGLNIDESYVNKLRLAILVGAALVTTVSLSWLAKVYPASTYPIVVALAVGFAYIRQIFPQNWPDIIIPGGVLFFFGYASPLDYEPIVSVIAGAVTGIALKATFSIFMLIYKRYIVKDQTESGTLAVQKLTFKERFSTGLSRFNAVYCIELALLLALGTLFMERSQSPNSYWVPVTILILLKMGTRGTLARVLQRLTGTVLGSTLGILLLLLQPNNMLMAVLMAASVYLWLLYMRRNFVFSSLFVTAFVILLIGRITDSPSQVFLERITFTLFAGILVLISSLISRRFLVSKAQV